MIQLKSYLSVSQPREAAPQPSTPTASSELYSFVAMDPNDIQEKLHDRLVDFLLTILIVRSVDGEGYRRTCGVGISTEFKISDSGLLADVS